MPAREGLAMVSPALQKYAQGPVAQLWHRPGLAPRDRSIVTVAALIARNQAIDLTQEMGRALDNGVKPRELSEVITHLAFYAGWPNVFSALPVVKDVIDKRPR